MGSNTDQKGIKNVLRSIILVIGGVGFTIHVTVELCQGLVGDEAALVVLVDVGVALPVHYAAGVGDVLGLDGGVVVLVPVIRDGGNCEIVRDR